MPLPLINLLAQTSPPNDVAPHDYVFILICAALVFLMQAGFSLVETGFSRSKNAINVAMKNFIDFGMSTIAFLLLGFGFMFGPALVEGAIGWDSILAHPSDSPVWIFFLFQAMFAGTAVTIASGAMAERTFFLSYVLYAFFAVTIIYPIIGHWAWGSAAGDYGFGGSKGWLETLGFKDFAGSSVVHSLGGACALAGIMVVGPRVGRFAKDGTARIMAGHNIPFATLGVFILWFGWFGFNCGSLLEAGASIGRIGVNTMIAGATGLATALIFFWLKNGWADIGESLNGALIGLVSITACCNAVSPLSAMAIGSIAGVLGILASQALLKLRLDDAVGAVPVHLVGGIWGTLCVSLFNEQKAFGNIGIQALGAFVIPITAFVLAFLIFKIIDKTLGLRASEDDQIAGLDFAEHSASAYPDFVVNSNELEEES